MKRFGIRITLPEGDPMGKSHLLGEDWESFRWYETEEQREHGLIREDDESMRESFIRSWDAVEAGQGYLSRHEQAEEEVTNAS